MVISIPVTKLTFAFKQTKQTNKQKTDKSSYHQFFVRLFLHEKAGLAEIEYVPNKNHYNKNQTYK